MCVERIYPFLDRAIEYMVDNTYFPRQPIATGTIDLEHEVDIL
jgi:hypothetical protein